MIDLKIKDPKTGLSSTIVPDTETGKGALLVATVKYKEYNNKPLFFSSPEYGTEMAENAESAGDFLGIHNGGDDNFWTGENINGSYFNFNSSENSYSGSYSIYCGNDSSAPHECQFLNSSKVRSSDYLSVSLWIYIDRSWYDSFNDVSFYAWDSDSSSRVGDPIYFGNYVNEGSHEEWQKANIPLSDMGISNVEFDAFRIRYEGSYFYVSFYIDDLQMEETGDPIIYTIRPERDTLLHIDGLKFFYAGEYDSSGSHSVPRIPYDRFLNVPSLESGLNYTRHQRGEALFSSIWKKQGDILSLPKAFINNIGFDGSITWVAIELPFTAPLILDPTVEDRLSIILSDDLSSLETFTVSASAKEEHVISS